MKKLLVRIALLANIAAIGFGVKEMHTTVYSPKPYQTLNQRTEQAEAGGLMFEAGILGIACSASALARRRKY